MIVTGRWPWLLVSSLTLMLASGCSHGAADRTPAGGVGLALRLVDGASIERVDFQITGNGITPLGGEIDVADFAATASTFVGGLPPGRGYRIEMAAVSTDGRTTCAGVAMFDVVSDQTTAIDVGVQCRGPADSGGVAVGGTINSCPVLTAVTVAPIAVPVGQVIDLGAEAADADARDTLTIGWTGSGGSIARGMSGFTTFTCSVAGAHTLTVTASDGHCLDVVDVGVACVPPLCGNGTIEPGEQCDPPTGITCDVSCQRLTVCGNAVLERTEECDPPNESTCDSTCHRIAPGGAGGAGGEEGGMGGIAGPNGGGGGAGGGEG